MTSISKLYEARDKYRKFIEDYENPEVETMPYDHHDYITVKDVLVEIEETLRIYEMFVE